MTSSLHLVAYFSVVAGLTTAVTWRRRDEPRGWARSGVVGDLYRQTTVDVRVPAPFLVQLAVPFAWAVVGASALRALLLMLEILTLQHGATTWSECDYPPCGRGPSFDVLSGGIVGICLVATGSVVGAFARWARDAPRDMNQARRRTPLFASAALVLAALAMHPLLELRERQLAEGVFIRPMPDHDLLSLVGFVHVGIVLLGAALIATARRSTDASGGEREVDGGRATHVARR